MKRRKFIQLSGVGLVGTPMANSSAKWRKSFTLSPDVIVIGAGTFGVTFISYIQLRNIRRHFSLIFMDQQCLASIAKKIKCNYVAIDKKIYICNVVALVVVKWYEPNKIN